MATVNSNNVSTNDSISGALSSQSGTGQSMQGQSAKAFLISLSTGIVVFVVQFLIFVAIKKHLARIYQPRTYLVPERERTKPSPPGYLSWILPVLKTSNSEFIQKCGLDAYFFLRFLRMLLKIFVPLALLVLPILLPMNKVGGSGTSYILPSGDLTNVTGLDQYAWGNVSPAKTHRYWAHLILAVLVITYTCYIFFDELRGYIRIRQAYLTSPQHRLRASATTVLVTAIPRKWLSVEALDGLYDVFPGGIRNIWINRNLDELNEKIKQRADVAKKLEAAETDLIKKCKKAQLEKIKREAKKSGKKTGKQDVKSEKAAADARGDQMARGPGVSSGDPHQVAHTVGEALHGDDQVDEAETHRAGRNKPLVPIPLVGEGLEAVSQGIGNLGHTVLGGLRRVRNDVDNKINTTGGLVIDDNQQVTRADDRTGDGVAPGYQLGNVQSSTAGATVHTRPSADEDNQSQVHPALRTVSNDSTTRPSGSQDDRTYLRRDFAPANGVVDDRKPLPTTPATDGKDPTMNRKSKLIANAHGSGKEGDEKDGQEYPTAINEEYEDDDFGEPKWKEWLTDKDRDTMRLPLWSWMISLPLIGKTVDTIYWCRKELARLNLEIEQDQQEPEKYALMNSAFIQFNHQVAAHMACQAISHHVPKQMAPRVVEISPDDVIWDNMSIRWWERYARTAAVIVLVSGMVIAWAVPVAFTGVVSQLSYLSGTYDWLHWISKLPPWVQSTAQGLLPPIMLAILMALLPLILRFLSKSQGLYTGMAIELAVQRYYFAFLFVQIFLVVSISSSITTLVQQFTDPKNITNLLAQNIPKSSNYFFSYLILQALSVSAGALVQIGTLFSWFILAPILDSTARKKWMRTTKLNDMKWGTFFPTYTTFASIGFIYSVIAPLMMVINIVTFGLFWFVYRYNTLYVTKFRFDTGGLLFPKAINQLFTGLYFMEICLVGLFLLVRDEHDNVACKVQAIIMIVVLFLTALFQILLNQAFAPLFQYLPITLEDDAVRRDEEFARAQGQRLGLIDNEEEGENLQDALEERERREREADRRAEEVEMQRIEAEKKERKPHPYRPTHLIPSKIADNLPRPSSWADRSRNRRSNYFGSSGTSIPTVQRLQEREHSHDHDHTLDPEAQAPPATKAVGEALFAGIHDELEDLTPDERDQLVQRAFQHEALRVKRPVIWVPRDDLGVSDDEIYRTQMLSKHIWISNEYQSLDGKVRCIFSRSPPDFSEVDLIQL